MYSKALLERQDLLLFPSIELRRALLNRLQAGNAFSALAPRVCDTLAPRICSLPCTPATTSSASKTNRDTKQRRPIGSELHLQQSETFPASRSRKTPDDICTTPESPRASRSRHHARRDTRLGPRAAGSVPCASDQDVLLAQPFRRPLGRGLVAVMAATDPGQWRDEQEVHGGQSQVR